MQHLGSTRCFIVSGDDGLGDVTLAGTTHVTEVSDRKPSSIDGQHRPARAVLLGEGVLEFTWQPEDFGITRQPLAGLAIDSPAASATIIRKVLSGQPGPARDIVVLNAAAGLLVAGRATEPKAAAALAAQAIDSGAADAMLSRLAARSHQPA